jgi:HD-GYP domain-containing protein (c-di-GMP phosphodiesterase class II)
MQSMVEMGGHEVRSHFEGLRGLLALEEGRLPEQLQEGLDTLENKVRELEVLCNLSLLMAEDLGSDLEKQFGRVLDRDADDLFALEAILAMAREMVSSSHGAELLDLGSARRVARYALAIATELKMDKRERRTLYHAALLRDLDIILSLRKVLVQRKRAADGDADHSAELATSVQDRLLRIKYLQPAMSMVSRRYERFDGCGNPRALGGADIPLGARILAVAEAFETMITPSSPAGVLGPEEALRNLAADSGGRFDPVVVAALLRALRSGAAGTGIEESGP